MSRRPGVWVSPTEFVEFASPSKQLADHIATRDRSPDFSALGMYLPNPDPVLKRMGRDIAAYRDLRADAHVGGCIRRRKSAVKALEWSVEQGDASARLVSRIEAIFKQLDMNRILGEMIEAALYGYQPMEVMWGRVDGWLAPVDIVGKPQEWFVFGTEGELRFRSRENLLLGEALPERKFLLPRQEPSYLNPYGLADLSMCFWPATFKRGGLKFWVTFTEKYGTPWLVGKTPRNTPGSETYKLLGQLEAMVQDAVAVIPDDSSVDIVEGEKTSSAEIYRELLMYCRSEISIALLGQNQTTEANSNRASATAGLEVTEDIRDADAAMIEAAMNQLIGWIVDLNTGGAIAPTFLMWEQEEVNEVQAKRDETLNRAGVRFTPAYWKRMYNLRDDDIEPSRSPDAAPAESGNPAGETPAFAEGRCQGCGGGHFAEGGKMVERDGRDELVDQLTQVASDPLRGWIEQLRALVEQAESLEQLRDRLLAAYGDLDTEAIAAVMELAFSLAAAQGHEEVAREAGML